MKAVLNNTDFEKIPGLIRDLNVMKIGVKAPDINLSEQGFSLQSGNIMFGLGSIKGLGKSVDGVREEREKNGPYTSVQDFALRTKASKTILENFTNAGAFDGFCKNRAAITAIIPDLLKVIKTLKSQEKRLEGLYDSKKIADAKERIIRIRSFDSYRV